MGFFDRLMGGGKIELTPKSALALAAMTMMSADGVVEESELMSLQQIVRGDRKAFDQAMRGFKSKKVEEIIPVVAENLSQQQRLATIAILLDLAMGDGQLADEERRILQAYTEAFELSEADVTEIIDVIAIKNNFSIFES
jgi:uncharacterized tellurite resistance protein B-like protein